MDLSLALGLVSAALFLSVALVSVAYVSHCSRRRDPADLERGTQNSKVADGPDHPEARHTHAAKGAVRRFGWSEIESLTANLSPTAVIGEGGFSTVYLARLLHGPTPSSTVLAAVKVHRSSERVHLAFRQELDVLLRLRHPYIVRLLGYCDDLDVGALVLEYVPGGTLHDRLHGGAAALPWARRMSIAYRLAGAVEYLHERCDSQVVHGDIKASNVLLDGGLEPKLCDFGSSRTGFSATVRPSAGGGPTMMGSPGYVDPHYLRTGMLSKKSDVYSFGVLLLELITGTQAFCSETERQLTAEVAPLLWEGRVGELVVDTRLDGDYEPAEAAAMAEVAARCIGKEPSLRPSMAEVRRIMREKVLSSISTVHDDGRSNLKPDFL